MNGAIVRAGAVAGVPTPVNAALAGLLDATASDPVLRAELARRPARIAELVEAAPTDPSQSLDHREEDS